MEFAPKKNIITKLFLVASQTTLVFLVFFTAFISIPLYKEIKNAELSNAFNQGKYVFIGETKFLVDVADSDEERKQGLSGTAELKTDSGLLFIFEKESNHGIWMKDMNFPIDIVWFDKTLRVVSIKENAIPDSYPETFRPTKNSLYVLEIPAGSVKKHGLKIDDQATLFGFFEKR